MVENSRSIEHVRRGLVIQVNLLERDPEGPRTVHAVHHNSVALTCSSQSYQAVRSRGEFSKPGIYLLLLDPDQETGRPRVYVGQTDLLRQRLGEHIGARDDVTHLVVFTSKNADLHVAHAQYLEARLIRRGRESGRALMENDRDETEPALSEEDQSNAEDFLEDALIYLPILGITAFQTPNQAREVAGFPLLHLEGSGADADCRATNEGYIVLSGARSIRDEDMPSFDVRHSYIPRIRQQLKDEGVLVRDSDGRWRFSRDYLFDSPSGAAEQVLGRSASGPRQWKVKEGEMRGKSLKDILSSVESLNAGESRGEA